MRKFSATAAMTMSLFAVACLAPAVSQAAPCDGSGAEQPFLNWHDRASYVLVSGGDFESGAVDWTLDGGAAVAAEGNPFRPASSASSLSLPAGASATTPATCVSKGDPVARIFARTATPAEHGKNSLQVEILYLNATGGVRKVKKAGSLHQSSEWMPSRRFSLAQGQFNHPTKPGRSSSIQLRFTPVAGSEWLIDDVFVDPHSRR